MKAFEWIGIVGTVVALTVGAPGTLAAQEKYPSRSVRVIVPFAAGGATDILTRVATTELSKRLGQSFVVENLTGAGGLIGAGQAIKAKPDGYTLLAGSPGPITIMPTISKKPVPYDVDKDVLPITLIADAPGVVVVGRNSPLKSLGELIDAAKSQPGKLSCGSSGVGAFSHLNCELFMSLTGAKVVHVPYKGAAPALVDLVGGRLDFIIEHFPSPRALIDSGEIRALAMTSKTPFSLRPNIPTINESGVPGYVMSAWVGLMAPAGTPKEAIDTLYRELSVALREPEVIKRMNDMGVVPGGQSPGELAAYLANERATYRKLSEQTGLKIE
jgi:tripartite-type tricarboxylate transporter receptor subunit TctC